MGDEGLADAEDIRSSTNKRAGEQLGWLPDNLVSRVANVRQALVLSRDGLVVAMSQTMSKEEGDQPLSAHQFVSEQ